MSDERTPEISLQVGSTVNLRVTGGPGDDLQDVNDAAKNQLSHALDGAEHVRDLKQSLDVEDDRNGHGVR